MTATLSQHWNKIQGNLFPFLEKEVGIHTSKHEELAAAIEVARVNKLIRSYDGSVGRPAADRVNLAHAFIAKAIYNLPTTVLLIDKLHCDPVLRRLCGWERKSYIPSESTFSRAFDEFAKANLASRLHEIVIEKYHSDRLIGHIARDSTAIEAREKANIVPKSKKEAKKKGRPKKGEVRVKADPTRLERQVNMNLEEMIKDLPNLCDVGCKKNSKGYTTSWRGYKLHIDTADGDIPVSAILTSASVHDSQVALPLAELTGQRITHLYDLMDAAYDADIIRNSSTKKGRVALIDFNHRSLKDTRQFSPHEAERYKARSSAERVNSNLKDNFGGALIRVKGYAKVLSHLIFGLLALTIKQTLRLLT